MRGETEYGVKALPLGGFVKITGMTPLEEVDPADEPRSFRPQARLAAGHRAGWPGRSCTSRWPSCCCSWSRWPSACPAPTPIGAVTKCLPRSVKALDTGAACAGPSPASPAELAGIRAGDKIISIAGQPVHNWTQLGDVIKAQTVGKPIAGHGGPRRPGR